MIEIIKINATSFSAYISGFRRFINNTKGLVLL